MNLQKTSDDCLWSTTLEIVAKEKATTLQVLHHLREIEHRGLHLKRGFGSLYKFCIQELHYSEGEATRRIAAMRLIKDVPEVEQKIQDGALSLTTASLVQNFLTRERRFEHKVYSASQKTALLQKIEQKSSREAERVLVTISPKAIPMERQRVITEDTTEVRFLADKELLSKLDEVKGLLAHKPETQKSLGDLLKFLCDDYLNRKKRDATTARSQNPHRRDIGMSLRRTIMKQDHYRCTFQDPKTGRVCGSHYALQIDHVKPWSLGGTTEAENLRVLCRNHNAYLGRKALDR